MTEQRTDKNGSGNDAAYGWRLPGAVAGWLAIEGHRFDFFQAVRLLEMARPDRRSVGEGAEPQHEAVRFSSAVELAFPASDIAEVQFSPRPRASEYHDPDRVTVNLLGLAGALGPLPLPITELIRERDWHGDHALREFLDIFNHRLLSLLYRVRKSHRVGFDHKQPGEDLFSDYLFSLIGLGTGYLREQMEVEPRSLLHYAGLLAHQPRSVTGLKQILSHYFQLPIECTQFCGRWHELDDTQLTRIGHTGQNQRLGQDAVVLGRRVWDASGAFELRVGPLSLAEFLDFLPFGSAFGPLCALTRFYVGDDFDFTIRLILKAGEIPRARLGLKDGSRLGWTSWLTNKKSAAPNAPKDDDEQVVLSATTKGYVGGCFRKQADRWVLGESGGDELRLSEGLATLQTEAFWRHCLFVCPTKKAMNPPLTQWLKLELAQVLSASDELLGRTTQVKDDTAVTEDDIAKYHLLLWGDPASNAVLAKILDRLPLRWNSRSLMLGGKYSSKHHVPVLVFPNPLNPNRYVVLNSGFLLRSAKESAALRNLPKSVNWLVLDVGEALNSEKPGRIVAAGLLD